MPLGNSSALLTILTSISQAGWDLVILAVIIVPIIGWLWRRGHVNVKGHLHKHGENHRILSHYMEGCRVPGSDPPRYLTHRDLLDAIQKTKYIPDEVVEKLVKRCEELDCPVHARIFQTLKDAEHEIIRKLEAFQGSGNVSRAETTKLVEGVAADVRLITQGLLPIIADFTKHRKRREDDERT